MPPLEGHVRAGRALFAAAVLVFFAPSCSRAQGEEGGPALTEWEKYQIEVWLPDYDTACKCWGLCQQHHEDVAKLVGLWTVDPEILRTKIASRYHAYWTWWYIVDAVNRSKPACIRRHAFWNVIDLIGMDAYAAKRWPACQP